MTVFLEPHEWRAMLQMIAATRALADLLASHDKKYADSLKIHAQIVEEFIERTQRCQER